MIFTHEGTTHVMGNRVDVVIDAVNSMIVAYENAINVDPVDRDGLKDYIFETLNKEFTRIENAKDNGAMSGIDASMRQLNEMLARLRKEHCNGLG